VQHLLPSSETNTLYFSLSRVFRRIVLNERTVPLLSSVCGVAAWAGAGCDGGVCSRLPINGTARARCPGSAGVSCNPRLCAVGQEDFRHTREAALKGCDPQVF